MSEISRRGFLKRIAKIIPVIAVPNAVSVVVSAGTPVDSGIDDVEEELLNEFAGKGSSIYYAADPDSNRNCVGSIWI